MILAWPHCTFAVATASYDEARRLRKGLLQHGVQSTLVTTRFCPDAPGRVVVGTYMSMCGFESNKRDIFICANAAHALGAQAQFCFIQPFCRYRLFGFMADDRRLSNWERDWLIATFGLNELVIPAHGYTEIRPRVVWMPFQRNGAGNVGNALQVKRRLVRGGHLRNRVIARVARAIAAGDCTTLRSDSPSVTAALAGRRPDRTIVLVDAVDHAISIAARLPGWPIVVGKHVDEKGLTERQRRLLDRGRGIWNPGQNMISTAAGTEAIDLLRCGGMTTVFWAGAGPALPPIPSAWRMARPGEARDILIVDVDERYHPTLAQWCRRRRRGYWDAEWLAPGAHVLRERIKRFLATRPRRR